MSKQPDKDRPKQQAGNQPDELRQPLPFSFLQFLKFALGVLDLICIYQVTNGYWQQLVVQEHHSRVYFVVFTYLVIAGLQIYFVGIYFAVKFLTRFHRRNKR